MFIQTEITPNPQTIKFLPQNDSPTKWQVAEWHNAEQAKAHPLAALLFDQEGVARVFLGADFISITKSEDFSWEQIKPDILSAIMDFFSTGGQDAIAFADKANPAPQSARETSPEEDEVANKIKEIIATRIQPAVAQDGGDIQLERFENGVAYLNMRGACAGCPSATITLKNGVENLLRYYVPELERVEANEIF